MDVALISTYVVTAAAMITAGAATAGANYLRQVRGEVRENTDRSTKNHQRLTGQNTPYDGVMPILERIEEEVDSDSETHARSD